MYIFWQINCSRRIPACIVLNYFLSGREENAIKKPILDNDVQGTEDLDKDSATKQQDICTYNCQENGGCSVRIESTGFINGATLGSCFSERFGGTCSGIPERCDSCLMVCKGKSGQQFSLPAKEG